MLRNFHGFVQQQHRSAGFSRAELAIAIAAVGILAAIAGGFVANSHRSKEYRCAANLKALGLAMNLYETDNQGRLPPAVISYGPGHSEVWDSLIFPLVPLGRNGLAQKHLLLCPADTVTNRDWRRRTYAMPDHSNNEENWPLDSENTSGVGVIWNIGMAKRAFWTNYVSIRTNHPNADTNTSVITIKISAITRDMIKAPASTLLLTEHAVHNNVAFAAGGATISGPTYHLDDTIQPEQYHGGKINYLMVDGHVELLFPSESAGKRDPRDVSDQKFPNIWTMAPDD